LRAHVTDMLGSDGKYSYILPVCEREKLGDVWCTNNFRLLWGGDAARAFVREHQAALKPGAAINVIFGRLRPHTDLTGTELQGHIRSAAMAPPRWPAAAGEAEANKPSFNATRQSADHPTETTQ
jgi:hypothetical protein